MTSLTTIPSVCRSNCLPNSSSAASCLNLSSGNDIKQWPPVEQFCGLRVDMQPHQSLWLIYYMPAPLLHSSTFITAVCGDCRIQCLITQVLLRPVAGRPRLDSEYHLLTFLPFCSSSNTHLIPSVRPSSGHEDHNQKYTICSFQSGKIMTPTNRWGQTDL